MTKKALTYILLATLVAGVLDILMAFLNVYLSSGGKPAMVLKFIASGIYDRQAFAGGRNFEAIGLALHFLITFIFVVFYFLLFSKNERVKRHWLVAGIVYGTLICLFMNIVVLPLSNTPESQIKLFPLFKSVLIQIIATGLPITYMLRRY
jgi:uncharacterized membrane protein